MKLANSRLQTKKTPQRITSVSNPDDYMVLLNKFRKLTSEYKPNDLFWINNKKIQTTKRVRLRQEVAEALYKLAESASKKNLNIIITSGFRSYNEQARVFMRWAHKYGTENAVLFSALPGHSQHQLGTTVDITTPEIITGEITDFSKTKEFNWLKKNAEKFGFVMPYQKGKEDITGYVFEPWHYRYIGVEKAKELKKMKSSLDEYLILNETKRINDKMS